LFGKEMVCCDMRNKETIDRARRNQGKQKYTGEDRERRNTGDLCRVD